MFWEIKTDVVKNHLDNNFIILKQIIEGGKKKKKKTQLLRLATVQSVNCTGQDGRQEVSKQMQKTWPEMMVFTVSEIIFKKSDGEPKSIMNQKNFFWWVRCRVGEKKMCGRWL